jgi:hypothetical protein
MESTMPGILARVFRFVRASLVIAALTSPAHAQLRAPQVPVSGGALANYFASQGQSIAVVGDQLDMPWASFSSSATIEFGSSHPASSPVGYGGYNARLAFPPLYQIFPGASVSGWFAVAAFRTLPTRLVVNLFDNNANLMGTTTYLAGPPDPSAFGFYVQGATGPFFTEDARNPDGLPRILAYGGTGARAGSTWFACELSDPPNGDFADFVVEVKFDPAPVPVHRATWGDVKQRFR